MAVASKYPDNSVGLRTISGGTMLYDLALRESHPIELDPKVHMIDEVAKGSPLLAFLSRIGSPRNVKQPIFFMLRKRQFERFFNITANYTTGTTLTVAAATVARLKKGYHILNLLTREQMRISSVPSGTTFSVERQIGTVPSASAVGTDDEFLILGYRGAEKDTRFLDFIRQPDMVYNYVGELQTSYEISQYEEASSHLSGHDPLAVLRDDRLQETQLLLEWALLFEQRSKTIRSDDSKTVYTTNGADAFVTQTANETDFNGNISEGAILSALRGLARYGPSTRWGLCSPGFKEKWDLIFTGGRRLNTPVPRNVGIDVTTYEGSGITLNLVVHPLFEDSNHSNVNSLDNYCLILNLEDVEPVTMTGPRMGWFKWFMNIQQPDLRGKSDMLVVNYGLRMTLPETHGRFLNA